MEQDRKGYRFVRLLTGGVTPVLLATGMLMFANWQVGLLEPGSQTAGICRELIAGTTVGRQALFGSCWVAPLPVLFYLPFAWLLPEPFAGWTAFFAAWLFFFWSVREAVKSAHHSMWRIVLAQVGIAGMMVVSPHPQALQVGTALMGGLMVLFSAALADWAALRRMRDVVTAGAAGAFLVLCGLPAWGVAGPAVVSLPFIACGHPVSRKRFQAWLLLGSLPLVYTVGVWLLMNRLILGDALFFVRSLEFMVSRPQVFVAALLLPGLAMLPAWGAAWVGDRKDPLTPGAGPAAALAVLVSFAVSLVVCGRVLDAFGMRWTLVPLHVCVLAVLMIAWVRLRQPAYRLVVSLLAFVWFSRYWFGVPDAGAVPGVDWEGVRRQVEEYVNARTPYGRVFVIGYAGLDLLRGYAGDRLSPNMDLHVGSLRRAYAGQNLYVLVPRPTGVVRAESVFWKHPDIYSLGGDRLLYAATFGDWRLFEVISAPTQEQLNEWRRLR